MKELTNSTILPINEVYICIQGEGKYTGIPHILVRFTGCPLRCQFSDTDFCDTYYSSWTPEKGGKSVEDILLVMKDNPKVKHVMISGGSPTLHPEVLQQLCDLLKWNGYFITIETEGSKFVQTSADFISLSPKLKSSSPRVGTTQHWNGKKVTESQLKLHEKSRTNYSEMLDLINLHPDYQLKVVVSGEEDVEEILMLQKELSVPDNKVFLMPAGATNQELNKKRRWTIEKAIEMGWNYTDRLHIIAYGDLRGV